MAPALDPAVVDLESRPVCPQREHTRRRRLSLTVTITPSRAEADVDDRRSRQAQQPVECRSDAHVVLLRKSLAIKQPAACTEGGCASLSDCATCERRLTRRKARRRARKAAFPGRHFTPKRREDPDVCAGQRDPRGGPLTREHEPARWRKGPDEHGLNPAPAASARRAGVQHRSGRLGVGPPTAPANYIRGAASVGKLDPEAEHLVGDLRAVGASAQAVGLRPEQHRVKRVVIVVGGGDHQEVELQSGWIRGELADAHRRDLAAGQDELEREDSWQRPVWRPCPRRPSAFANPGLRRQRRGWLEEVTHRVRPIILCLSAASTPGRPSDDRHPLAHAPTPDVQAKRRTACRFAEAGRAGPG